MMAASRLWCMARRDVGWARMMPGHFPSLFGVVVVPFKANAERRHHIPSNGTVQRTLLRTMQPCTTSKTPHRSVVCSTRLISRDANLPASLMRAHLLVNRERLMAGDAEG